MANITNSIIYGQQSETPEGWYPPSYWPDGWEDEITDSDDGFVMLCGVFPNISNECKILIGCTVSGGTLDWGDGTVDTIDSTSKYYTHTYDYSSITEPVITDGYKIVTIVAKCTSGEFADLNLNSSDYTTGSSVRGTNYLALKVRSSYTSGFDFVPQNPHNQYFMQYADFDDIPINPYTLMRYAQGMKKLICTTLHPSKTTGSYMFQNSTVGSTDFDFNALDYSNITNFTYMFGNMYGGLGKTIDIEIDAATNLGQAFRYNYAFRRVLLSNTGNVTSINACLGRACILEFQMDDCSSVSNTAGFVDTNAVYNPLEILILSGLTIGINLTNGQMSAEAINNFFTSLGTAAGAQTITVTGNPGAATCDTSIATGKGWTVTT